MKIKNKRKSSLKSSILILLLVAVLLVASSYAWFTANKTVTLSSLDVSVQAQNGLQLSVDGTNWKSVIQKTDIIGATGAYAKNVNQVPTELEPVSTAAKADATSGFLDMFLGSVGTNVGGDYILTSTKEKEVAGINGKFIAFDLFFKVTADMPVYLSANSNVKYKDGKTDRGLQNAARVAFVTQGNLPTGSAVSDIQALHGATAINVWEPNFDVHSVAAVANARDTYGITTSTTGGTAVPYDGIMAAIGASEPGITLRNATAAANPTLFGTVTPTYRTAAGFTTNQSLFTLTAGITKVRMYMWVEGQDVDCEDTASGADISFNIQVTSVA